LKYLFLKTEKVKPHILESRDHLKKKFKLKHFFPPNTQSKNTSRESQLIVTASGNFKWKHWGGSNDITAENIWLYCLYFAY